MKGERRQRVHADGTYIHAEVYNDLMEAIETTERLPRMLIDRPQLGTS